MWHFRQRKDQEESLKVESIGCVQRIVNSSKAYQRFKFYAHRRDADKAGKED